ncbi:hypothetical protein Tco_1119626, partial [Tanacetum coccineum]
DDVIVISSDDEDDDYIVISSDDEDAVAPILVQPHVPVLARKYSMINEQNQDVNMLDQTTRHMTTQSYSNTNSATIDVHVDVEQLVGATTAKMDQIWVDLVRKEIKSLLDIIDSAEQRIETDTNVVEGLMKLVLQNMKDTDTRKHI